MEPPVTESHDIPLPMEEKPLPFKTDPMNETQQHAPKDPDETKTGDATKISDTEDTPDSETPVTDNKGFD